MDRHLNMRVATILFMLAACLVGACSSPTTESTNGVSTGSQEDQDLSDPRRLVGYVDHVFVGRVLRLRGVWETMPDTIRETSDPADVRRTDSPGLPLYDVETTEVIKGSPPGRLTVIGPRDMDAGREYMFATNPQPNTDWQWIVSRHGYVAIEDGAERARLIREFRQAYEDEIPPDPGRGASQR